jgi:hypothetical protein
MEGRIHRCTNVSSSDKQPKLKKRLFKFTSYIKPATVFLSKLGVSNASLESGAA